MQNALKALRDILPDLITREHVDQYLGHIISPKYLANLDSQHKGPKAFRFRGRKVVYPKDTFFEWLENSFAPI